MRLKLILRENPQERSEYKYYAYPVNEGNISLEQIAGQISGRSSMTYGDVLGVLQNCIEVMPIFLMIGKSISLGNLGTLRMIVSSEGVENAEDFHVSKINKKRVRFTPSSSLKKEIRDVKFEVVRD